ncbi:outer membrane protein assembly factor BamE domain-containing protein [Tichowtungia aerotolerans]|uniref:Outer membrane protein assembly factor BamE n=1 Tax=Tichowtungia aerotolerans TaxID=2697043 RepID=A0A6P1M3J1_9BACT|nr:outer membrane protein assembly factor BamE [Tichowtungia aerotolerans]QHI68417.1 outer membrane protein assembly factor BamE [Tichowtungia aerotolerans]
MDEMEYEVTMIKLARNLSVRALILVTVGFMVISGCAYSSGTKSASNLDARQKIVKGQTSKNEVLRLFGPPTMRIGIGSDRETWSYSYAEAKAQKRMFIPIVGPLIGSVDSEAHSITIGFDSNGVVKTVSVFDQTGGRR